jgi:uncharacterized membrane protein
MSTEIQRYREPLDHNELLFLEKRETKDRKTYFRVYRLLMILSFVIPFVGAWYRAYDGAPNAFSPIRFFFSAAVLLGISSLATYITYRVNLRNIQLDLKEQTKTIETSQISRKLFVLARNTCYFYITSHVKMSIEVSADDYERLNEGDEISIEYATHSKLYLGYF